MATPNIVPRANNEGNLGTSAKKWKKMYTTTGFQIGVDNSSGTFQMNSGDNGQLIWEGSASDAHQTKLQAVNPTADLIYKLPDNAAGTYYLQASANAGGFVESFIVCASDETTAITTGDNKVRFVMPYGFTLVQIKTSLSVASSSGSVTVQVTDDGAANNINSSTITIAANSILTTTNQAALIGMNSVIGVNIDGAGTGAKGLKVTLIGRQTTP
tara:strand:- start:2058 stop:2699 length:642 start_codon:yes stop_codon:yes gene_type:complete